jgi:hypothetical protein
LQFEIYGRHSKEFRKFLRQVVATLRIVTRCFLLLLLPIAAYAERPSIGMKVGVTVSGVCESQSLGAQGSANACADRHLVGPAVQFDITHSLFLDVAALYTRLQLQGGARSTVGPSFSTQRTGNAWEFPILPKYRLLQRSIAPVVGAGPSFRRLAMQGENTTIPLSPSPGQPVTAVATIADTRWGIGLCLAAGVEFRTRVVRFSPEIRYSRWSSQSPCRECGPYTLPLARESSTVLLLGISF